MSLSQKMKLTSGTEIVALNAPAGYKKKLGILPAGVTIKNTRGKNNPFIQLFVKNKAELEREFPAAIKALAPGGMIWITFPKTSSGMQTDLSRDKGWELLDAYPLNRVSLISFDNDWSAFLLRNEPQKKQSKAAEDYQELIAVYTDARSKTVTVPPDLQEALGKNKKAAAYFEALSYSNRKEYVLWIVSAKQAATRKERIAKAVEKLGAGKKNPSEK